MEAGLLKDEITVTGRTLFAEAKDAVETPGQEVVRPVAKAIKPHGGLAILRGSLAPEGAVVKLVGHERMRHTGPARVFDGETAAFEAVQARGSRRATSSSSATRGRRARPGCPRCSA